MSQTKSKRPIGPMLASVILDWLEDNPEHFLRVTGRKGGQPNVRYRNGEWQYATWAGAGELMTGTKDREDVKGLVMSGPIAEIRRCDELEVWREAHDANGLRVEWSVNPPESELE